jgi:hypothetical protein
MATESKPGIGTMAFNTVLTVAPGCGFQALTAPTVTVSCPARTSAAPDCSPGWLVAFDTLPIRRTPLPALVSADQLEGGGGSRRSAGNRRGGASFTFYLRTAAGRVRVLPGGDHDELQRFRAPIVKYLADEHAPPLDLTIWPNAFPWRWFADLLIGLGLLQGAIVITRIVRRTRRPA